MQDSSELHISCPCLLDEAGSRELPGTTRTSPELPISQKTAYLFPIPPAFCLSDVDLLCCWVGSLFFFSQKNPAFINMTSLVYLRSECRSCWNSQKECGRKLKFIICLLLPVNSIMVYSLILMCLSSNLSRSYQLMNQQQNIYNENECQSSSVCTWRGCLTWSVAETCSFRLCQRSIWRAKGVPEWICPRRRVLPEQMSWCIFVSRSSKSMQKVNGKVLHVLCQISCSSDTIM